MGFLQGLPDKSMVNSQRPYSVYTGCLKINIDYLIYKQIFLIIFIYFEVYWYETFLQRHVLVRDMNNRWNSLKHVIQCDSADINIVPETLPETPFQNKYDSRITFQKYISNGYVILNVSINLKIKKNLFKTREDVYLCLYVLFWRVLLKIKPHIFQIQT